MLWIWLLEPTGGVNKLLKIVGIKGPNWLFDPDTAMPAIIRKAP
jgi:ABC-type sugar transport system permease subunit